MRRDIRCHTYGDTVGTVYQKLRHFARQYRRFLQRTVIVRNEFYGVFINIFKKFVGYSLKADFGVPHSGRAIAVDRTEVSLPVYEHFPHGEILRHTHKRVINGDVAVRVIFTEHVADHTGGFLKRFIVFKAHFLHGVKYAAVYRFKAVPYVGQSATDDYAHGVINERFFHFFADVALFYIAEQINVFNFLLLRIRLIIVKIVCHLKTP